MANINSNTTLSKMILRILLITACMLLIINFARSLFAGNDLSFSSFLEWLGNVDSAYFDVGITDFTIYGNWGVFDFLRGFLNIFTGLFSVIVFFCANLINLIFFVLQFVRFIFI
ncbi:MAG: hypothetical protein E7361_03135 [Clostridiales bacterium]|nr:hypothetical protein [Clostridiales bacterium]